MRKHNLIGLIIAALIVHIILPLFLHNGEVYVFDMPLPWTTSPLQLMYTHSEFYERNFPIWGIPGITGILIFYFSISLLVFIGTLLFGRRLQCATLCLFNGFASEVFGSAIPIVGKQKKVGPKMLKVFNLLRWISFIIALFFTLWWIQFLVRLQLDPSTQAPAHLKLVTKLESIKYLSCELLMAMFFWVAYVGRAYCYYCPLGTLLGLISKLAGQRISTQNSHCVGCNQCNKACPMSLDIKAHAQEHTDLSSLRCVGCGHCIDACPTQNLSYTTHFLDHLHHRLPHQKKDFTLDIKKL